MSDTVLSTLVNKASSSPSSIWKWVLGTVIAVIALFTTWLFFWQRKKIAQLTCDKLAIASQLATLQTQLKQEANEDKAKVIIQEITETQKKIVARDAELAKLREAAEQNKKDIERVTEWSQIK